MNTDERIFCGNGKVITTQYGDMVKISFSKSDLEKMLNNLDNGWINTVLKEKKNKVEGKPTHYLEVDTWKPSEVSANNVNKKQPVEDESDSLPF